jgi:hypothetical protein
VAKTGATSTAAGGAGGGVTSQTAGDVPRQAALKPAPAAAFQIRQAKGGKKWIKATIYGGYGVGKTTLAASAADVEEMGDVIVADAESGEMSIEDDRIDVIPTTSFSQFARIFEFLRLHCQLREKGDLEKMAALESKFKGGVKITTPKHYNTVIIDSLTEVQKYCMYQLLGINIGSQALDLEPESPEFKEWGRSREMIGLLVRSFRDLPMHVIIVCSEDRVQNEKKQFVSEPNLPGKLSLDIQGFMDIVGYMQASPASEGGEQLRRLYLTPGKTYAAKNRFKGWTGNYIDAPSMAKLFALAARK